jgi:hypothetical protein
MGDALDHLSNRTKLEWTSSLNTEYTPKKNYRRTSIICTIGESLLVKASTHSSNKGLYSRTEDKLS